MGSQVVRVGAQLVGMVVLARLLTPSAFGLMAMASVVSTFASMFRDLGISAALIQNQDVNADDVHSAKAANLAVAAILAFGMLVLSNPLARMLGDPEVASLIRWLAWTFPLSSLGAVPQALLERNSQFRILTRIEMVSSFAGLATALLLATRGAGAFSFAAQALVYSGVGSIQLVGATKNGPKGKIQTNSLRKLLGFGGNLTLFNVVNYFSRNADNILVGRRLGEDALGIYSQAYKIMLFPIQNVTLVAGRALLPILSRGQSSPDVVWNLFLKASGLIAAISAPLFLGIGMLGDNFVAVILGERWNGCVPLLPWLCACGTLQALTSLTGTMLISKGKTRQHLVLGCLGAALQVSSFVWGVQYGLESMCKAYLAASICNAFVALGYLIHVSGGTYSTYLKRALPPFVIAALGFFLARQGLTYMTSIDTPFLRLTVSFGLGGLLYFGFLRAISPWHVRLLFMSLLSRAGAEKVNHD